ncbi:hypothetical protein PPERSA_11287 [Pseudocohnilembus persalinus]|uniref:Uncharacterized protein n=1 Tax=Pseudocohnilembus persalinus TaxID=266149 RepID=A0A0V0QP60_PSEPJ|nr:hypothetical protein PPERSA_11287 [Pseudocohnilembus persalinus]|eukprot:KRX04163.1 hypothetical protein PPERSA_11287 [Pseudocohnilembus persalinus]
MDPKEEQIQELKQYLQKANDYILEIKNRLQLTENKLVLERQNFLNVKQINDEFELKLQDAQDHIKSQQLDIQALQNKEKNYKNQIEILYNQQKNCPYCNTKYVQNRDSCRPSFRSSNQRNTYKNNQNQNNDNQQLKYNNSDISEELHKNSDQNNIAIQQNEDQQQQDENPNNQENEFQKSQIMRASDMHMRKVETNEFGNLEKTTTYQNRQDFQDKGYMQKKNMSQLNYREENLLQGSGQQGNQFNLIEAFTIVSADLKDMEQIKGIDQSLELEPKIIYQFAKKEQIIKQQLEILPNLCFPEGISVKKMQKTKSLSQIEEELNLNWQENKKFQFHIPEKEKSYTVQAQWAMLYAFNYLQQESFKGEMLDYEQITNKLLDRGFQDPDPLLQSIFKTQMFHKYLEDYYSL